MNIVFLKFFFRKKAFRSSSQPAEKQNVHFAAKLGKKSLKIAPQRLKYRELLVEFIAQRFFFRTACNRVI